MNTAPLLEILAQMRHGSLQNYGIPGLKSSLIGSHPSGARGMVRLFEASHTHEQPITPHSHRFDFTCLVLSGRVRNRIWRQHPEGQPYFMSRLTYDGEPGKLTKRDVAAVNMVFAEQVYCAGGVYSMEHDDIHSIFFDAGTTVLFFEGPPLTDTSVILEPFVDGSVVPTFKVEPWMFKKTP